MQSTRLIHSIYGPGPARLFAQVQWNDGLGVFTTLSI